MKVRPQIIKPSWYPRSPSDPSWESLSLLEKMSVLTQRADANKPCGVFRKCNFPDGPAWIAQTNHPHAQGHTVRVQKRAGDALEVLLGEPLVAMLGDKPVANCFRIGKPTLRAVDSGVASDVAELEKLYKL